MQAVSRGNSRKRRTSNATKRAIKECTHGENQDLDGLCADCKAKRHRILARRAARLRRSGGTDPGYRVTGDHAQQIAEALQQVGNLEIAIRDRLRLAGKTPQGDTETLFGHLTDLRAALKPLLEQPEQERIELNRPGGRKRARSGRID